MSELMDPWMTQGKWNILGNEVETGLGTAIHIAAYVWKYIFT